MNLLMVYATNSGSTYLVSKYIHEKLTAAGHQVQMKNVTEAQAQDLTNYDVVFLGSNSWDFESKEGQPHHAFVKFLDQVKDTNLANHRYAVYGCGDKTYMIFCGALNVISEFVNNHSGILLHEPLRIDRYYFNDPDQIHAQIDQWLGAVTAQF